MNKFFITTAIPYVNARPHIGHALEFVQADALARFHRLQDEETLLLSGSDENALKNVQAAESAGEPIQQFVDENAKLFVDLGAELNVNFDVFQKGSSKEHCLSSQKLWDLCARAGDIYQKSYKGLYCVGCEAFYNREDLNKEQECFEHPGRKLEEVSENNYFFKLSRYQERIIDLIEKDKLKIIPQNKKNEILAFLRQPLQDISISRTNERAKNWGVPVPGDDTQRMYVWFDALNIYQTGVGFSEPDQKKYKKWWPVDVHVIGKGITRFHAVYWPAFLMSAGLSLPKVLFVHGYVTMNGQKMSKSLGNVVDPFGLIKKYGADAVRYFLLREIPSTEDGDFTEEKFINRYNADLAGGIGNLVARVLTLAMKFNIQDKKSQNALYNPKIEQEIKKIKKSYQESLENFKLNEALISIWDLIKICDKYVNDEKPWSLEPKKDKEKLAAVLGDLLSAISEIAGLLKPFLPQTAEKISKQLQTLKSEPLFPRFK
jgi:methionyl-tRNA synthetase